MKKLLLITILSLFFIGCSRAPEEIRNNYIKESIRIQRLKIGDKFDSTYFYNLQESSSGWFVRLKTETILVTKNYTNYKINFDLIEVPMFSQGFIDQNEINFCVVRDTIYTIWR